MVAEILEVSPCKPTSGVGWPVEVLMKAIEQGHPVMFAVISLPFRSPPMHPHGSITGAFKELRSDDPAVRDAAARYIWDRYFRDLLILARNNLDKRIRLRMSEEDVAQSMFKSFCLRQQRGEFELTGRDDLWKLLVTITVRKARNAAKAQRRDKRDVAREQTPSSGHEPGSAVWVV